VGKVQPLKEKSDGIFGGILKENFPNSVIEDDGRLRDNDLRENFLHKVFLIASFRALEISSIKDLMKFQADNFKKKPDKLLLPLTVKILKSPRNYIEKR